MQKSGSLVAKRVEKNSLTKETWRFPEKPEDLLPHLPRDKRGIIYLSKNLRIRPEIHNLKPDEVFNPRHHSQHYHVERLRKSKSGWGNNENYEKLKPPGYNLGDGTGFLPGEFFPEI